MLYKPKNVPPEPYHSAALYLLYRVAFYIRNNANEIDPRQLLDLGEAIHDIPESLTEYGHYFDEQIIRDKFLAVYDQKWAQTPERFSLPRTLDDGIARVAEWQKEQ